MNPLQKLIGQKVKAKIEDVEFEGIVHQINIDDYYFYEKDGTISITVSVIPTGDFPEGIDEEEINNIPLDNIKKA